MKLKSWIIPVLSVELLALAFRLWQQGHEMDGLQHRLSHARWETAQRDAERATLQKEVQQAQEKAAAVEAELSAIRTVSSPLATKEDLKIPESILVDAGSDVTPAVLQQWLKDANDPAVMRRLNLEARNETLRRYGDLFTELNLDSPQALQLTLLLADKRQSPVDVAVTTFHQGEDLSRNAARYREIVVAADVALEQQINTLLGEARYAQYRDYDTKLGQNDVLRNVELALHGSTEPLTAEQATRIKDTLRENNEKRLTLKVVTAAREFLSPLQLQTLQDLRAVALAAERKQTQQLRAIPTPLPVDPTEE